MTLSAPSEASSDTRAPSDGKARRSAFGRSRHALHGWLTILAARVRPRHPDWLLDALGPDGTVARAFLEAGAARRRAGQTEAARAILERGVRIFPESLALIQAAAPLVQESGHHAFATAHWEAAAQAAPDDPLMACGLSASLRADFQPARASSVIEAVITRFPTNADVIAEAARVAAMRGRHERALHLWSDLAARDRVSPEILQGRVEARGALDRAAAAALAVTCGDATHPEVMITQGELMLEFESLGDNCEFGLAQRYSGVEPLGLFRFTESDAANLDRVFQTCFEAYGTEEDLFLDQRHGDQEYVGSSLLYNTFKYHTEIFGPGVDEAELRRNELRKLAYLKQRLLSDVRSGEKIFVRKQGDFELAMALSRTIRGMGPNVFLWVEAADADHPVGHVEVVEPGLLRGYISKFAWYGDARAFELHDWVAICRNALGLAKGIKGQQIRYRLPENAVLQTGQGWDIAKRCLARRVPMPCLDERRLLEPCFDGRGVEKLTLLEDTQRWDAMIAEQWLEAPLSAGTQIVFSVWILVPAAFKGTFVDVYFANSPEGYLRRADLESRDVWQRIYASTKLPKGKDRALVSLRVTGCAGDALYVATWSLETGFVPNSARVDDPLPAPYPLPAP